MSLPRTLNFIWNHPLNKSNKPAALFRFLKWQIISRIWNEARVFPLTEKSKLLIKRGMTGATGSIYCGLLEFEDMAFALHFLRKEDLFIDIGANVGVYTILSSAHVKCQTIAVEPVPTTYRHLIQNINLNHSWPNTTVHNIALGSAKDIVNFTSSLDTINHIAVGNETDIIQVPIDTLDNILGSMVPQLIKIDVEGFESEVIKGGEYALQKPALKAIIIELNGSGQRYGYQDQTIHKYLIEQSFQPYKYEPFSRQLLHLSTTNQHNTIYVRDADFVEERVRTAKPFTVLGQTL